MKDIINDLEALKIAINIEKHGERFYTLAADKLEGQDKDAAAMLRHLAQEEIKHAKIFERLYAKVSKNKEKFDDSYLYEPEVTAYFKNIVDNLIFPSESRQDELLKDIRNVKGALKLGIKAEEDSIKFYTGMIAETKYEEAKDVFKRLLAEERRHLKDLKSLLDNQR